MTGIRKFMFETDFEAPPPPPPVVEPEYVEPEPPPPPTFSEAELESARRAAYDEGLAEGLRQGRSEALSGQGHLMNQMLSQMEAQLATLLKTQINTHAETADRSVQIALTIARKLVPNFAARHGLSEIEAMVRQIMSQLQDEPRLVVRTHDSLLDAISTKVQALAEAQGYAGKLVFMADPTLGPGDCRLEWADGGAERDSARIWAEVDRVVANAVQSKAANTELPSPAAGTTEGSTT